MALDNFISSMRSEAAKRHDFKTDAEIDAFFIGMEESAKDNQEALEKRDKMLRDTVAELCKAKSLLEAAVEDIHKAYHYRDECCDICKNKQTCTINCAFVWQHEAEALALLGKDIDVLATEHDTNVGRKQED